MRSTPSTRPVSARPDNSDEDTAYQTRKEDGVGLPLDNAMTKLLFTKLPNIELMTIIWDWVGTNVLGARSPCLLPIILCKKFYGHQLQHQ